MKTGNPEYILNLGNKKRENIIIWNNKDILVDGKSSFHFRLFRKGIVTLEDLVSDKNEVIVKENLNESTFTPLECFS